MGRFTQIIFCYIHKSVKYRIYFVPFSYRSLIWQCLHKKSPNLVHELLVLPLGTPILDTQSLLLLYELILLSFIHFTILGKDI